ncbi:O-antigen ligase family protein [Phycicoccus sp. MAQZ13P-2]|uniref:O-antigen ligase family protein n=1 Tax=Phycicoccus mangrovi TaxID=2840470 RepID=UPI001C001F1D|nr:O-antigen ligase family protein [Phycicoccus mangrovi]MBT9257622.1 O-antigen ligase family protein [Phycicoccus mangrovi]MBT9276061.1 O-antigen ligase family protein [Phycicoccus mangrovi]
MSSHVRSAVAVHEDRRRHYKPHEVLFAVAMAASVLPALPPIAALSGLIGIPVQAPAVALWTAAALIFGSVVRGVWLALILAVVGAAATLPIGDSELTRAWFGVLLVPLALFVGLQAVDTDEVQHARAAFRWVLFGACGAQVFYYVATAGIRALASPSSVYVNHTNVDFWGEAGKHVLANPNNAAVIFCTAFGWAVAERASGTQGRLSAAFVLTSATAIYLTGSRGAWLTAGAILLLAALFHVRSRSRVALLLTIAVAAYIAVDAWVARFEMVARTGDSANVRLQARVVTVSEVIDHPIGHGVGTTADVLRDRLGVVSFLSSDTAGATSHDLFLNWGVCVGWVGLGLLLVLLAVAVRDGYRGAGFLALLPLLGYMLCGELVGLDILNSTNAAWSTVLVVLIGLGWRGGVVSGPSAPSRRSTSAGRLDLTRRPTRPAQTPSRVSEGKS